MPKSPYNAAEARHFTHLALHGPTGINKQMRKGLSFTAAHAHVMKGRQLAMKRAAEAGGSASRVATWGHVVKTLGTLTSQDKFNAFVSGHNVKQAHRLPGFKQTSTFGQNSLKGLPTRTYKKSPRPTKVMKPSWATNQRIGGTSHSAPTGGHRAMHDMMTVSGRKALGTKVQRAQKTRAKMQKSTRGAVKPKTAKHVSRSSVSATQRGGAMRRGYYYRKQNNKRIKVKYTKRGQGKRRTRR